MWQRPLWDCRFSLMTELWFLVGTLRMAGTALLFQISCEMMGRIPILRSLRSREKQAGKDVTLQDEHQHLPEPHSQHTAPPSTVRRPRDPPQRGSGPVQGEDAPSDTVYVGNLPGTPGERAEESPQRAWCSPCGSPGRGRGQGAPPVPGPRRSPARPLLAAGLAPGRQPLEGGAGQAADGQ